jgi:hypothetical protein
MASEVVVERRFGEKIPLAFFMVPQRQGHRLFQRGYK